MTNTTRCSLLHSQENQACSRAEAPVKRGCLLPGVHVHPLGKKSRFFPRPHACPPPPGLKPLACGDKASTTGLSWDGRESSTPHTISARPGGQCGAQGGSGTQAAYPEPDTGAARPLEQPPNEPTRPKGSGTKCLPSEGTGLCHKDAWEVILKPNRSHLFCSPSWVPGGPHRASSTIRNGPSTYDL